MTDYLRTPLKALTLGFDLLGFFGNWKPFHQLSPVARRRQIEAWKSSSSGFKRDLIRYYESLATLALYSRDLSESPHATSAHPLPRRGGEGRGEGNIKQPGDNLNIIGIPNRELRHEIVVIGSGPGGAITACLLAEAGRNVLLIEEGPFYSLASCVPFTKEEMVQKYRNGGQTVAMGTNKIAYVEGRCVGGGSEINSGLYHRTPPDILESWRKEFQVDGSNEIDLLPHFEACEKELSVSLLPGTAPAASLKLHDCATQLGWKSFEVPRWFRYDANGSRRREEAETKDETTVRLLTSAATERGSGKRQSMTETYVPRFLNAGGQLLPLTRVQTIHQDGGRWTLFAQHASVGALRIESETLFVCGGAVQTPTLLRRSGIKRNIGNSLRLHPTIKLVARFSDVVNSAHMGVPVHQVKEFAPRFSFGCSISTPPYLALGMIDHPEHGNVVRHSWQQMANYYAMITGEGRGTVRPLPGFRDPLVRYTLTRNDRRDLAEGLHKLTEALFASGAVALYPGITRGGCLLRPDDLAKLPNVLPNALASLMTIHLFSSCPMGENKTKCAVDSFGRLHGFKNLFVADASLLCTAPGVNPQGSIMALARRNALRFLGGH
ncbi:MAG: GMC family oxidoreductase [Verrucomicrobia bacterium]|nr:GMC family oxidoreductase [Verrucomicrobiota bacterium]